MIERSQYVNQEHIAALHLAVAYLGTLNPPKSCKYTSMMIEQYDEKAGWDRGLEQFFPLTGMPVAYYGLSARLGVLGCNGINEPCDSITFTRRERNKQEYTRYTTSYHFSGEPRSQTLVRMRHVMPLERPWLPGGYPADKNLETVMGHRQLHNVYQCWPELVTRQEAAAIYMFLTTGSATPAAA